MEPYQRTRTCLFKGDKIILKYVDIMEMMILVSNLQRGIIKQYPPPTLENEKHMQELYAAVIDEVLEEL